MAPLLHDLMRFAEGVVLPGLLLGAPVAVRDGVRAHGEMLREEFGDGGDEVSASMRPRAAGETSCRMERNRCAECSGSQRAVGRPGVGRHRGRTRRRIQRPPRPFTQDKGAVRASPWGRAGFGSETRSGGPGSGARVLLRRIVRQSAATRLLRHVPNPCAGIAGSSVRMMSGGGGGAGG